MTRLFNAFERMKRRRRCSKIMLEWFHPTKKIKSKLRRERRFKNRNRKTYQLREDGKLELQFRVCA